MRISDWSSDVSSSDLRRGIPATPVLKRPSAHSMNRSFSIVIVRPSLRIRHGEVRAAAIMLPLPIPPSPRTRRGRLRSEEHTSELQSLMRISYAVFCLKKKKIIHHNQLSRSQYSS